MYQMRLNSFNELPRDKRPPRYMWDRPYQLSQYLEHVWDKDSGNKNNSMIEYDLDDLE